MKIRNDMNEQNIGKRGKVPKSHVKREEKFPVGPVLLGLFMFVVVGSALFGILRTASANYEI